MVPSGSDISPATLLGIAGEEVNVFNVTNFEELEGRQAMSEAVYASNFAFSYLAQG